MKYTTGTNENSWTSVLAFLAIFCFACPAMSIADTIHLKNGAKIYGKVSREESTASTVVIQFGEAGTFSLPRNGIQNIEENELTASPGESRLAGKPVPAVLEEAESARPKKSAAESAATVAPHEPIATTHKIFLKQGGSITGNLVASPENEPLVLQIGSVGKVNIPRDSVLRVEEEAGEIRIHEVETRARTATRGTPTPVERAVAPEVDILEIEPELLAGIEENLYELTRWRTRNRVRAETHLKRIGSPAIPFLALTARNPFNLTRRATMRIVRDVGDPVGIPVAIESLMDDDRFVREIAQEALRSITHLKMGYNPNASSGSRFEAQKRWHSWWTENYGPEAETPSP